MRIHDLVIGSPTELVDRAIADFSAGDDDAFLACVHSEVVIWADPQLAHGLKLEGRHQLAAWCREARQRWSHVRFEHGALFEHGAGVFIELDVITQAGAAGGAWRLPIAVFFRDELVVEVLPQPDREAALSALEAR